jgi:hypothetical protein
MMGELIVNHPKFVKRWAKRCLDVKKEHGAEMANSFFNTFFNKEQRALINKEIRGEPTN